MVHICTPALKPWNNAWNVVDAIHDAAACKSGKKSCKSVSKKPLFQSALKNLFENNYGQDPYSLDSHHKGSFTTITRETFKNALVWNQQYGIIGGLHDNLKPEGFGLPSITTPSQFFDPAPKIYNFNDCTGFNSSGSFTKVLTNCGFPGYTYEAKKLSNRIVFRIFSNTLTSNLEFKTEVDRQGYVINCNNGLDLTENYIAGNLEKNYWIENAQNSSDNIIIAMGFIICKVIGDYGHTWFCEENNVIFTGDSFLLKRCIKEGKKCVYKHFDKFGSVYRFYNDPRSFPMLEDTRLSRTLRGGNVDDEETLTFFLINIIQNKLSFLDLFQKIIYSQTNSTVGRKLGREIIDGTRRSCRLNNYISYIDEFSLYGFCTMVYENQSKIAIIICLALFVTFILTTLTKRGGSSHTSLSSEDLLLYLKNKINLLSLEYDNFIDYLEHFLQSNITIKLNGVIKDITDIKAKVKDIKAKVTSGKPKLFELLREKQYSNQHEIDEEYFKWVPTRFIFHSDFMKTILSPTIKEYYQLLPVKKLFPNLDDQQVLDVFELSNYIYDSDIQSSMVESLESFEFSDSYKFEKLLQFLEHDYVVETVDETPETVDETPETIPKDDMQILYPSQIQWLAKNGVSKENAQIFCEILYNATEKQLLYEDDIIKEIFKEFTNGDIVKAYMLYNICYPFLNVSKQYILRYDFFIILIKSVITANTKNEKVKYEIYQNIFLEMLDEEIKPIIDKLQKISTEVKVTNEDELIAYCIKHKDEINLDEFISSIDNLLSILCEGSQFVTSFYNLTRKIVETITHSKKQIRQRLSPINQLQKKITIRRQSAPKKYNYKIIKSKVSKKNKPTKRSNTKTKTKIPKIPKLHNYNTRRTLNNPKIPFLSQ